MTALTVYGSNIAATTLTTAGLLDTVTGGASIGIDSTLGTATGIGEMVALGTVSAWAALGSYPTTPSGKGYLYDSTALEGLQIPAGTWTPTMRITAHNGTANVIADLTAIVWIRHSNTTYTKIGTCTLAAQTISFSASTTFTFAGTSLPVMNFATGDKLYIDYYANVTTNANGSTTTMRINESSSGTQGNVVNQVVTPGFFVAGSASMAANSALAAPAQIAAPATSQSNSVITMASAQVAAPAAVQSNSVTSQASALIITPANIVAIALLAAAAQLTSGATVQANSIASQTSAQVSAPSSTVANAALAETAQVSTGASVQANAAITASAQLISGASTQANSASTLASSVVLGNNTVTQANSLITVQNQLNIALADTSTGSDSPSHALARNLTLITAP